MDNAAAQFTNSNLDISAKIEAILFWKAEPISIKKLTSLLGDTADVNITNNGLLNLENKLKGSGLTLVRTEDEVMLGTAKEFSLLIEKISKEELMRDLGKAGLETLSIVLYQGPISRADIDYIRGVNSQFILRNLLIRGLIERIDNPDDARSFLYKPTLNLLANLGTSKIEDLPEYALIRKEIDEFKKNDEQTTKIDTDQSEKVE